MRLSYPAVLAWLATHSKELTAAQLEQLDAVVQPALAHAREEEKSRAEVLQKMDELAKSIGAASAADLLRLTATNTPAVALPVPTDAGDRLPRTGIRKPYLNPFERDSKIYASKSLKSAEWFKKAEKDGWTPEQCHHENLLKTWKNRGMQPLYDNPTQEYETLKQKEQAAGVVYSRTRRAKSAS